MPHDYAGKRAFDQTPEPPPETAGDVDPTTAPPGATFMVHQHHATRLHFDLRLEMMNGDTPVLVSWAVPKNLPQRPGEKHLAIHVEDHPFDYGSFSGTIPAGNYGAGEVRIFDSGTYEVLEQAPKKLTIKLEGRRLRGIWHMIQTRRSKNEQDQWLVFLRENHRPDPEPLEIVEPMKATLVAEAFDDDDWVFEPKWDGIRALATCTDETVLVSRTLRNITPGYPDLSTLHRHLVCFEAMLDGEIVAMSAGRPSFERLQGRMNLQNPHDIERAAKTTPVTFIAFDVLYLDGRWVIDEPWERRREMLEEIVIPTEYLQVSTAVVGEGRALFNAAEQQRLEGIVAKKTHSPYRPGRRGRDWLKVKTTYEADVVIGGWRPGEGSRSTRFGALLVGAYDGEGLRFLGAVGTGFTDKTLTELLGQMSALESSTNPFSSDPRDGKERWGKPIKDPHWIEPRLVAAVEFRELTSAGRLRAPSFKGLRSDKNPKDCLYEELTPKELPHDAG
jgi:bifunctional non-homologous end joining protein LigD